MAANGAEDHPMPVKGELSEFCDGKAADAAGPLVPIPRGEESDTNLIINYLPQKMNQESVKALFSSIGEIESCKLVRERSSARPDGSRIAGQSLGYAFVKYYRPEDAQKAVLKMNQLRIFNKVIKVSYARPSSDAIKGANLYVNGLPKRWSTAELEKLFAPYGTIVTSRILRDYVTGLSKGVGFVRFDLRAEAERAIEHTHGAIPDGGLEEPLTVKFANTPGTTKGDKSSAAVESPPLKRRFQNPNYPYAQAGTATRGQHCPYPPATHQRGMIKMPTMGTIPYGNSLLPMTAGLNPSMLMYQQPGAVTTPQGWTLFVFNLDPDTDESLLWQLFGPFGAVQAVKVVRDPETGKCRRFGFVTMSYYHEAMMAIQYLNGYSLNNRTLQVSFGRGKEPSTPCYSGEQSSAGVHPSWM